MDDEEICLRHSILMLFIFSSWLLLWEQAAAVRQNSHRDYRSVMGLTDSSELNRGFALWQDQEKWRKQVSVADAGLSHIVSHGT